MVYVALWFLVISYIKATLIIPISSIIGIAFSTHFDKSLPGRLINISFIKLRPTYSVHTFE